MNWKTIIDFGSGNIISHSLKATLNFSSRYEWFADHFGEREPREGGVELPCKENGVFIAAVENLN